MPRNVELKARLTSLAEAERVAESLSAERLGTLRQIDTYFHVAHGRLKLREIVDHPPAQLIGYERTDTSASKLSDYRLIDVPDPQALKETLAGALGVRCVVEKRRTIFILGQVRIHLDNVLRLGTFIEFEAVLAPEYDESAGHAQLRQLCQRFGIVDDARVDVSYVDLLTA